MGKKKILFMLLLMLGSLFIIDVPSKAATMLKTVDSVYAVNADGNTLTLIEIRRRIKAEEYHIKSEVEIEGKVYRVTGVDSFGVEKNLNVNKLYFDEGIIEIYPKLLIEAKELYLPSTIKTIPRFKEDLTRLVISENNPYYCANGKVIYSKDKKKALYGNCRGKLVLPEGVEEVSDSAFAGSGIISVQLPKSLKRIGKGAFLGCDNLISVSMKSVERIGKEAFGYCKKLKKVTFSKNLKRIDDYAFSNTGIRKIELGKRFKQLGKGAFFETKNIVKLTIDKKNPYFKTIDDAIYTKNGKVLIEGAGVNKPITIPKKVKTIKKGAFLSNIRISHIKMGSNIKSLPSECFKDSGLESIELPAKLKKIGKYCFSNCELLRKIKLPSSLQSIQSRAFEGCGFKKLTIPEHVKFIGENALFCSVGVLVFKGIRPPVIKEQGSVENIISNMEHEDEDYFPYTYYGIKPGIQDVIVPKKSVEKYDKIFDKTMKFKTLDW